MSTTLVERRLPAAAASFQTSRVCRTMRQSITALWHMKCEITILKAYSTVKEMRTHRNDKVGKVLVSLPFKKITGSAFLKSSCREVATPPKGSLFSLLRSVQDPTRHYQ
jgi:hypothetical protein